MHKVAPSREMNLGSGFLVLTLTTATLHYFQNTPSFLSAPSAQFEMCLRALCLEGVSTCPEQIHDLDDAFRLYECPCMSQMNTQMLSWQVLVKSVWLGCSA